MTSINANKHLTLEERKIIETGISNGSAKAAIAITLIKDKSTIGKEIFLHRTLTRKCSLPLECAVYQKCKLRRNCTPQCPAFVQLFKFLRYGFMFIIFHQTKTSQDMYQGILLLESILGEDFFNKEVQAILTDRGSEFTMADETEIREDGTRRTRLFYCDPMASG